MKHLAKSIFLLINSALREKDIFILLLLALIILNFLFTSSLAVSWDKTVTQADQEEELYTKVLIRQKGPVKGNQKITLNLVDPNLLYIEFYIDGILVCKDEEPPWQCVHNFGHQEMEHEVRVIGYYQEKGEPKALGEEPQEATQETQEVPADEAERLKVIITSPQANTYVSGRVVIKADISIPTGIEVERVEFYVDRKLLFTDREAPYEFEWDAGKEFNRRIIEVVAYDKWGRRTSDAIITKDLEGYIFEAKVELVTLDVTVADKYGKYVAGLNQKDFIVFEDAVKQQISHFTKLERPLTIGILIDTSGSMQYGKLMRAQAGAKKFVNTLKKDDQAFVMSFSDEVEVKQNFTNAVGALGRSIDELEPSGYTALNKAVYQAIEKLKEEKGRKAIILLSDGYDTVGEVDEEEVLEAAKNADVKIYCIGIFESRFQPPNPMTPIRRGIENKQLGEIILKSFSDWTGGEAYFPNSLGELDNIYMRIAQELRQQYSLGYTPSNQKRDGNWRKIEVKLKNKKLKARTKKGYYAPEGK